jgi:hypothetical protein
MIGLTPRTGLSALAIAAVLGLASVFPSAAAASVYQWSVPVPGSISPETKAFPEAFLWIPPHCRAVRAVVLGQHNLLEEPLFEAKTFRKALSRACIGEVWVTPMFDTAFDFTNGAGGRVDALMNALAEASGYGELSSAPIVPIGHSAAASFPWNFAAWAPQRTLALVSLKGDAPLTTLTGSGKPNPAWGARTIEGVPSLMVMGEYEWLEPRLSPRSRLPRRRIPDALISLYADAGHGHFDLSEDLARLYRPSSSRRSADARLPSSSSSAGTGRAQTCRSRPRLARRPLAPDGTADRPSGPGGSLPRSSPGVVLVLRPPDGEARGAALSTRGAQAAAAARLRAGRRRRSAKGGARPGRACVLAARRWRYIQAQGGQSGPRARRKSAPTTMDRPAGERTDRTWRWPDHHRQGDRARRPGGARYLDPRVQPRRVRQRPTLRRCLVRRQPKPAAIATRASTQQALLRVPLANTSERTRRSPSPCRQLELSESQVDRCG